MYTVYIIIVAAAFFLCLFSERIKYNRGWLLAFFGLLLMVFAGFKGRDVGVDDGIFRDFYAKAMHPLLMFQDPKLFFSAAKVEPVFLILASFFKYCVSSVYGYPILIFFFALCAVSCKMKAIRDYSDFMFFSLFIYICNFFLLHEIIQIRAGLAVGIALLSFRYILRRDFPRFAMTLFLAVMVHYSAIMFFPFYFVNTKKIPVWLYVLIPLVPYVLMKSGFDVFEMLGNMNLGVYSEKIKVYKLEQYYNDYTIHEMNLSLLFQILLSVFLLINRQQLSERNPYGILFLKINIFAIAAFYLFFPLAVFAFRFWEMMSIVQIFLIPSLIYFIKPRWLAELLVLLVGVALFYNLVLQGVLQPYHFVRF